MVSICNRQGDFEVRVFQGDGMEIEPSITVQMHNYAALMGMDTCHRYLDSVIEVCRVVKKTLNRKEQTKNKVA